jgi:hypothetical protein
MSDFAQIISDWETFYLLSGTAAATLIGLLFIAVSIHIEIFNRQPYSHFSHFAALTVALQNTVVKNTTCQ